MTDQDKIAAILASIQDDSQLLLLLRTMVATNIINVPSTSLDAMLHALGLI